MMYIFHYHFINPQKICQIFMVRESLQVPLPIFWLWPSTSNIQKTFKSPYISTEVNKYWSDNIPLMGQTMEEILMSRDTTIFLMQHLGFILNMEKSILNLAQEILGLTVNSVKMAL